MRGGKIFGYSTDLEKFVKGVGLVWGYRSLMLAQRARQNGMGSAWSVFVLAEGGTHIFR